MEKYIFTIVCLLSISIVAEAKITTHDQLIHTVERSRVVSMRIIKAHALIGIHNQYKHPEKELEESYLLLEQNLHDIEIYLHTHQDEVDGRLLMLIDEASMYFSKLKENDLLHDTRVERAIDFFNALEKSRVNINKAAEILTRDKLKRDPVFFTTRIATIGQKMAAVYLYKSWGIALPKRDEHFEVMTRKSKKSIAALGIFLQNKGGKLNVEQQKEAEKGIRAMQNQLMFFVMSKSMKQLIPSLLYKKANNIEQEGIIIEKLLAFPDK